jgi:DNA-binding transcriptional LysR family regulator
MHSLIQIKRDNSCFRRYFFYAMDTRFLESFVAVVDNGSIAEAARRLNLTPAAIAQRIRTLETEVGSRLIIRSGRTVRSTEAGAVILDRARSVLGEIRDLKSAAASDRASGQLRLGAFQSVLAGLVPDILRLMTKKYPRIEVYIVRAGSAELYRQVLDGDLDGAIIVQPPFTISKACDWRVLREEPLIVLTSAKTSVRNPHTILASEPFIRLDRKIWTGRLVDGYLRKYGIRPRERYELDGAEAIAAMVDRGLGVSLMPDWAPPWPEGLSLAKIAVRDRTFTRRIGLIWARTSARVRLVNIFLEVATMALAPKPNDIDPRRKRSVSARRS